MCLRGNNFLKLKIFRGREQITNKASYEFKKENGIIGRESDCSWVALGLIVGGIIFLFWAEGKGVVVYYPKVMLAIKKIETEELLLKLK